MRDVTASKLRIYTNGVFTNEKADATGTAVGIGEPTDLVIGNIGALELYANTTPAPYKGLFDELKIFNYALSATEITQLYNAALLSNDKFVQNTISGTIYPNPAKEQIFISIPNYKESYITATLSDVTGTIFIKEKISSDGNGIFKLDLANKRVSGLYILNVSGENLNSNYKIMAE
jgi:hypothetical protein